MENSEQILENSNKSETIPENSEIKEEEKKEPPEIKEAESESEKQKTPAAKAKGRGRPKGSADAKPRIKRIPITPPEEEEIEKPKVKVKKVVVQEEPEEEQEQEQEVAAEITEPEAVVSKSPRTLRREHMQTVAAQKRAITQARQDRFERVLDGFMGF